MEKKLGQEPAFPTDVRDCGVIDTAQVKGMNKRFYAACAACAAMQGFIAMGSSNPNGIRNPDYKNIIAQSYTFADELLKQENE